MPINMRRLFFIFIVSLLIIINLAGSAVALEAKSQHKKVLVTAATGELGRAICNYLASQGYDLLVTGRNQDKITELVLSLKKTYPKVNISKTIIDFSDIKTIEEAATTTKEQSLTGIVLITPRPSLSTTAIPTPTQWSVAFAETFIAPLAVLQAFSGHINKNGSIVIISGLTSKFYMPNYPHTNVIRLAWSGELKNLTYFFSKQTVRVNAVSPGIILTDHHIGRIKEKAAKNSLTYDQQLQQETNHIPLKTYGTPLDVASLVCFLLGPTSKHLNGVNIPLDGGECMTY
jgi:3-oxoacyl-[acyl-carrier protein] reductase